MSKKKIKRLLKRLFKKQDGEMIVIILPRSISKNFVFGAEASVYVATEFCFENTQENATDAFSTDKGANEEEE